MNFTAISSAVVCSDFRLPTFYRPKTTDKFLLHYYCLILHEFCTSSSSINQTSQFVRRWMELHHNIHGQDGRWVSFSRSRFCYCSVFWRFAQKTKIPIFDFAFCILPTNSLVARSSESELGAERESSSCGNR